LRNRLQCSHAHNLPNCNARARRGNTVIARILAAIAGAAAAPVLLAYMCAVARANKRRWQGRRVVVILSEVPWDEVWQRPQEFAVRAAKVAPVVYASPVQAHRWLLTLAKRWALMRRRRDRDLIVLSPITLTGHYKSHAIMRLNCWMVSAAVRPWIKHASEVRILINSPYLYPVIDLLAATRTIDNVVYDVIDDFTAFDWSPAYGRQLDTALMQRADAVITGTHELLEQRSAIRDDVEFVPCGVDYQAFANPRGSVPEDIAALPQPILGYWGSISERIDLALLDALCVRFPQSSVVLIGPLHMRRSQLPRRQNCHWLGIKSHDALPAYAARFSVGLIPFRLTEATLKLNPVKTLEYLAAGIPVVSTRIPDVERFFGRAVAVAGCADEFLGYVAEALANPNQQQREVGRELAEASSWDVMTGRILGKLGWSAHAYRH
jgi:glycosyltransferase involved in cell wall biosynthesis